MINYILLFIFYFALTSALHRLANGSVFGARRTIPTKWRLSKHVELMDTECHRRAALPEYERLYGEGSYLAMNIRGAVWRATPVSVFPLINPKGLRSEKVKPLFPNDPLNDIPAPPSLAVKRIAKPMSVSEWAKKHRITPPPPYLKNAIDSVLGDKMKGVVLKKGPEKLVMYSTPTERDSMLETAFKKGVQCGGWRTIHPDSQVLKKEVSPGVICYAFPNPNPIEDEPASAGSFASGPLGKPWAPSHVYKAALEGNENLTGAELREHLDQHEPASDKSFYRRPLGIPWRETIHGKNEHMPYQRIEENNQFALIDTGKIENDAAVFLSRIRSITQRMKLEQQFQDDFNNRFGGFMIVEDISKLSLSDRNKAVDRRELRNWIDEWILCNCDLSDDFKRNADKFLEKQFNR